MHRLHVGAQGQIHRAQRTPVRATRLLSMGAALRGRRWRTGRVCTEGLQQPEGAHSRLSSARTCFFLQPSRVRAPLKPEQHHTRRHPWERRPVTLTSGRSAEVQGGHPLRPAPLAGTLPPSRRPHRGVPSETQGEEAPAPGTSRLQHLDLTPDRAALCAPPIPAALLLAVSRSVAGASAHTGR